MHTGLLGCYMYNLISISKFRNSPSACLHQGSKFHHQVPFSKYKVTKFYINEFPRLVFFVATCIISLAYQSSEIALLHVFSKYKVAKFYINEFPRQYTVEKKTGYAQRVQMRRILLTNKAWWWNLLIWCNLCMLPVLLAPTIFAMASLKNFWIADKVSQQCVLRRVEFPVHLRTTKNFPSG